MSDAPPREASPRDAVRELARELGRELAQRATLAGGALADRGFSVAARWLVGTPTPEAMQRAAREVRIARDLFEERGWLEDPAGYHRDPPPLEPLSLAAGSVWTRHGRVHYRKLRFESGYVPHVGEPGRTRWLAHPSNEIAHVRLLERDPKAPWLVCLHGFGMGTARLDLAGFSAPHWFARGLNLAFPVLPLHGSRGSARLSGGEVFTLDYLRMVHLFSQAASDVRQVARWLRGRGASKVGLHGVSLGGHVAALVAGLEDDLDCVIAGLPAVDFAALARDNEPPALRDATTDRPDREHVREISVPVSPLSFAPRVRREALFIYAGRVDRVVRPEQPRALWRHWGEPEIHWFDGGHVFGIRHPSIPGFVARALARSGLLADAAEPDAGSGQVGPDA